MRKNYSIVSKLASLILAVGMLFSLTSCEDILGKWDSPSPIVNKVINTIVDVTGATPEAVTAALQAAITDEAVAAAAAKGEPIKIIVSTSAGIGTETADKTITIPQKNGANIEISFAAAPTGTTSEPLEFKAESGAGSASAEKENELAIAMPDAIGLVITIDLPKTTVTLTTTGTNTVYKSVTAKTAQQTLTIAKGVKVETLNAEGGSIVVKDGVVGTINVSKAAGTVYLDILNGESPVEKLVIEDEADVVFNSTHSQGEPFVKEIEGGTEGTAKLRFNEFEYVDNTDFDGNNGFLASVEKLKNVTVAIFDKNEKSGREVGWSELFNVPTDVENVIFDAAEVSFRTPGAIVMKISDNNGKYYPEYQTPTKASTTIKNCTFRGKRGASPYNKPNRIYINIPATWEEEGTTFTYTFESCNIIDENRTNSLYVSCPSPDNAKIQELYIVFTGCKYNDVDLSNISEIIPDANSMAIPEGVTVFVKVGDTTYKRIFDHDEYHFTTNLNY